jgi:thiosulfate/3-mercaptopyruvate sulfurtransferase
MALLISAAELKDRLDDPQEAGQMMIFDASFFLPTMQRDAEAEFAACRLPGARFFDIDAIADPDSELPHMVPSADIFTAKMQALGLRQNQPVVVYDNAPFLTAPRAWWLLTLFGHQPVQLLDGGLPAWLAAGGPLAEGAPDSPQKGDFIAAPPPPGRLVLFAEICRWQGPESEVQIVDARAAGRFAGLEAEPRPGLRSGHIPGAKNLPVSELIDSQTGLLHSPDNLRRLFEQAGIDLARPIVTSCGSGVTAAALTLALHLLGRTDSGLYDGSWSEYGASNAPLETS